MPRKGKTPVSRPPFLCAEIPWCIASLSQYFPQSVPEGWGCFVLACVSCLNPILIEHRTFLPQRTVPKIAVSEPSLPHEPQHTRLANETPDHINICTYISCIPLSQLYDFPKCEMVSTVSAKVKINCHPLFHLNFTTCHILVICCSFCQCCLVTLQLETDLLMFPYEE